MVASEDLTGLQVDSLVCLGDTRTGYIQCKCLECGTLQERTKPRFKDILLGTKTGHITCQNKLCKYHSYAPSVFSVGTIHNSLKITKQINKNTIMVQCLYCGDTYTKTKSGLRYNNFCRNKSCKGARQERKTRLGVTSYIKGDIYNNMQVLKYNSKKTTYQVCCIECLEKFEVNTKAFRDNKNHCKNINCFRYGKRSMQHLTGLERHNLKCLGYEIENNKRVIEVQCKICGKKFICRDFSRYLEGKMGCTNKECSNSNKNYTEPIRGDFKVIAKLEDNRYIYECIVCKHRLYLEKLHTKIPNCKYHPHARKKFEGLFNNFVIEANAYTYKEDDYFICSCTKCGYRDILTASEMLQHQCEERNFKNE